MAHETQGVLFEDFAKTTPAIVRRQIKQVYSSLRSADKRTVQEVLNKYKEVGSFYRSNTSKARNNVGFWVLYGYTSEQLQFSIQVYVDALDHLKHSSRYRTAARNFFYPVDPPFIEWLDHAKKELTQKSTEDLYQGARDARHQRELFLAQFADQEVFRRHSA